MIPGGPKERNPPIHRWRHHWECHFYSNLNISTGETINSFLYSVIIQFRSSKLTVWNFYGKYTVYFFTVICQNAYYSMMERMEVGEPFSFVMCECSQCLRMSLLYSMSIWRGRCCLLPIASRYLQFNSIFMYILAFYYSEWMVWLKTVIDCNIWKKFCLLGWVNKLFSLFNFFFNERCFCFPW